MRSWAERSFNSQYLQLFLTIVVALNVVPFFGEVPMWVLVLSSTFIIWSALYVFRLAKLPNRISRWIFAIGCMSGVLFQFRSIVGQEPATALLILLASLKLLETVRYRDAMYVTFISYFLLMDYVLISQTLPATIYMVGSIGLITTLLFYLHGDRGKLSIGSLRTVMRTLWLAIPIWLFLFVIFPRFSAALWTVSPPSVATSGFSDELNPGDIAQLVDSDQLAFRATFLSGPQPRFEQMYWRGGILWNSEGLRWTKKGFSSSSSLVTTKPARTVHEVVLEPGFSRFIFGLDSPVEVSAAGHSPRSIVSRPGFIFERFSPATLRTLYTIESVMNAAEPRLQKYERLSFLQIPETSDRLKNLAQQIKNSAKLNNNNEPFEKKISGALIDYFLLNKFRYTKTPGAMSGLDDFLFDKKVGFCEHYASAYSTLMRMMDVPSRVVVGFQGGIHNRFADHWTVRALDAHAWSEIYIDGVGWERVDPTAFIAPLRLTLGGDFNQLDSSTLASNMTREQFEMQIRSSAFRRTLANFSLAFDLISGRWNNFLLRYDFEYQSSLLDKIGVQSGQRAWLFASLIVGMIVLLIIVRLWMRRAQQKLSPLVRAYRDLCQDLRTKGLARLPSEGPIQFASRAVAAWPSNAAEILSLLDDYAAYRYGAMSANFAQIRDWRRRAKNLSRQLPKLK